VVSSGVTGGWFVGLTPLPPSRVDSLKILGASTSWSLKGLYRPVWGYRFVKNVLKQEHPSLRLRITFLNYFLYCIFIAFVLKKYTGTVVYVITHIPIILHFGY
jgi:hypothetical protein